MKKQRCTNSQLLVDIPDRRNSYYELICSSILFKQLPIKLLFCLFFVLMTFQQSFAQFKVIGYLPTWGGDLNKVQYSKLTHINYAFLIPTSNGGYQAPDDPTRLKNLVSQAHANGVKVIISVGGGGGGDAFRTIVPNASYRTAFVNNMLSFVNQYNLDGVDIDWEFPSDGTEANNFALMMQELSAKMHNNGKVLTAAVIAYGGTSFINSLFTSCDFINIMAYDENSYDHSTYDLGVKSVNYWVGRGLDKNKAVLGVPFYGRDNCCSYKTVDYSAILAMGGSPNADTYNNKIGYNGIPTIKKKTTYAMGACSGIMIWSIDTDVLGANSLLSAIDDVVKANSTPVPDNLAKGKTVTVSSTEASTTTSTIGSNATDGSYSTRWASAFADPQSITVDLGANYNVNRVKLSWEAAYATAYQIQISNDNSNWTNLKSVSGNTTTTNDQTGLSGTGRYIRIYGTARATVYGYSLYEIEVYGTAIESPYSGTAINLPGKIETENYDLGGEGLAFHDTENTNQGGAFRTDGVDIEATTDAGAGYNIGYTADGEWLKYMVNVTAAGTYSFDFRTASTGATSAIRLEVDGIDVTGTVILPNTGAWQTWATTTVSNVNLTTGAHTIRLFIVTGGFNINYVNVNSIVINKLPTVSLTAPVSGSTFTSPASIVITASASDADGSITKVDFYNGTTLIGTDITSPYSITWTNVATGTYSIIAKATDNSAATTTSASVSVVVNNPIIVETPYGGSAATIPGTVQAENYNNGGEGLAYHDLEAANQGGAYRTTEGVDIEATTDAGGGFNIGYTADGEWMNYIVNVTASGTYDLSFRTASTSASGVMKMEVDGNNVTGAVALPNTGGWQTWATTTIPNVAFSAGAHSIKISIITGGFNLNSFSVSIPVVNTMSFLHASGKNIVNNNGNYLIKAANLGNYMVQEGYMLNLGGGYQHIVQQKIADAVGTASKDQFYKDYLANFITKDDIDSLAKFGFNAVRLPMHYNLFTPLGQSDTYIESGFALVDNVVSWCKANNMYVILDLHAAPGGQSSGDISDYIAGQPSLWESDANRAQTVKLWRKFAERYANEPTVGAYDLINETNWTLANNNQLLMQLMKDITTAIRQVDNNHMVFIEGNSYANDYNGLTPKWDNNMAYSFHKYWNDCSQGSLNFVLAIRDGQNVPIWLGEFGENSNNWIADAVTLMNNNNIGWAIWPYKKMSSVSSIGSFKEPSNWTTLSSYINGGAKPSAATTQAILNELVENVKCKNTTFNKGYLYALLKQPGNTNTVPYMTINLPGKVLAAHYDEGKNGYAYNDANFQNTQYGSTVGSSNSWNNGWYYRNDGVDLQYSTPENGPTIGYTEANEWMNYTVNVTTTGTYTVKVRAAGNGGNISISLDGSTVINNATVNATGGWDVWQTITLGTINLTAGKHTLRATITTAGYNLSSFDFSTNAPVNQAPVVSLTSPANNASYNAPASVSISASASDADGTVSKVDFYNGTTLLVTDATSPYTYTWTGVAVGTYSITAKATDNLGATTTSSVVTVTVNTVVVTNPCSGIAQYAENAGYVPGSKVQNAGSQYQCKPYPYSGWCNGAAWAYGPGTGAYWTDAWTLVGTCTSTARSSFTNDVAVVNESLISNAPNPFTSSTSIELVVAEAGEVSVLVYDKTGRVVGSVVEGYLSTGTHTYNFDATNLKNDMYIIKMNTNSQVITRKIVKSE